MTETPKTETNKNNDIKENCDRKRFEDPLHGSRNTQWEALRPCITRTISRKINFPEK